MKAIRWLLAASMVLLASACATVTTAGGEQLRISSDRFAMYAERVFREQNRVASMLAFALADAKDPDGPGSRALADAEDDLLDACAGLNEVAARRRDGERPGVRRGLRAAREAPGCERATAAAEAALEKWGQS
jgi:hypothetical protein